MVVIPDRASRRNNFHIIPLLRPRIERERDAEGCLRRSRRPWLAVRRSSTGAWRVRKARRHRTVGAAMTSRRRLPQRRGAIAVELEHAGHHFRMQIGCFPDGALGEVFLDAAKQNSGLDAFAADAAILVSLLLQHGATPAEIGHALRRAPDGTAASLVGAVVDRLAEMGRPQS